MNTNDTICDGREQGESCAKHVPGMDGSFSPVVNGQAIKNQKYHQGIKYKSYKKIIGIAKFRRAAQLVLQKIHC